MRLWRDGNVAVVRYLRVLGAPDPYAAAREGWVTVVRGLGGFQGDEIDWRVWILGCARLRAGGRPAHRGWVASPFSVLPGHGRSGAPEAAADDELAGLAPAAPVEPAVNRGVNDTIAAISELPLGQGEILMLRLVGELPVAAVADVVGTDVVAVHRSEDKAIERLGAERELIAWSLAAPPLPLEQAGEHAALTAFRSVSRRSPQAIGTTRVIALGSVRSAASPSAFGRSRAALVGIAALSATMMSLGGLSAAAYMGVLPDDVQQVMHHVIGAPAPGAPTGGAAGTSGSPSGSSTGSSTGSSATANLAVGLCRAWTADQARGVARDKSAAFRRLAEVAGGSAMVDTYCEFATRGQPKPAPSVPHPGRTEPGSPTHPAKTTKPGPTHDANPRSTSKPPSKPIRTTTTASHGSGRPTAKKANALVATPTHGVSKAAPQSEASGTANGTVSAKVSGKVDGQARATSLTTTAGHANAAATRP
jgi:DNA-directed RNA polymerase specialized sigma24 family protein